MSNFSISHRVFNSFEELSSIFIKSEIVVCKLLSVWKSLKFVVWERVKNSWGILPEMTNCKTCSNRKHKMWLDRKNLFRTGSSVRSKEKHFSFSHAVFQRTFFPRVFKKSALCGKTLKVGITCMVIWIQLNLC